VIVQTLPPHLLSGRTAWVHNPSCVEFDLDVGFGITVRRSVVIEGLSARDIPEKFRNEAKHCLVTLLGGKRVLVLASINGKTDPYILGRVYLNEKVYGEPVGYVQPPGLDARLLEIGLFCSWLAAEKYDIQKVKAVLNGTGPKGVLSGAS